MGPSQSSGCLMREEALRLIRDRIEQRGHDDLLDRHQRRNGSYRSHARGRCGSCGNWLSWPRGARGSRSNGGMPPTSVMTEGLKAKISRPLRTRRTPGNDRHHGDDRRAHLAAGYEGTAVRSPQAPHIGRHRPARPRGEVRRLLRAQRHHGDAHRGRHRGHEPPGQGPCPERSRCHLRDGGGRPVARWRGRNPPSR